jgi:thiol:disulfide interchange protein DsbD
LLPRAGAWMDTVKHLFGVVFLGVAVYMILPLIPPIVAMLLWAVLAGVSGYWLFTLTHGAKPAPAVVRGFGLLILVYGIALLFGALAGRSDPLQPLAGIGAGSSVASAEQHSLPFKRVKTVADLDNELAAAKAAGKTAMLDFYATWCTSCKEMEKYTFPDPQVAQALANTVWLQADITANDDIDLALLKHLGVFSAPNILFFGTDGLERKSYRLAGFLKAPEFQKHVTAAFSS